MKRGTKPRTARAEPGCGTQIVNWFNRRQEKEEKKRLGNYGRWSRSKRRSWSPESNWDTHPVPICQHLWYVFSSLLPLIQLSYFKLRDSDILRMYLLAPMVRYSKLPFRTLVSEYETHITYTPMILSVLFPSLPISTSPGRMFLLNSKSRKPDAPNWLYFFIFLFLIRKTEHKNLVYHQKQEILIFRRARMKEELFGWKKSPKKMLGKLGEGRLEEPW